MADPSEELVIEVEVGIADPPFIAIPRGQVLSPMSVGRRGMWRIEGSGVLDVHAYVYFDGKRFFLQSVDERTPVIAHGHPIGRAWTSVSPPCKIELGTARLHFRATYTEGPDLDDQETAVLDRRAAGPLARPFKPGEFARRVDSESTRVKPLDAETVAVRAATPGHPPLPAPPPPGPPVEEIPTPAHLLRPPLGRAAAPPPVDEPMDATRSAVVAGLPPPLPAGQRHLRTVQMQPVQNPRLELFKQRWDQLSGPKKILIALLPALLVSLYFLFVADDEPPRPIAASKGAGAASASAPAPDAGAPMAALSSVPPTLNVSQLPIAPPPTSGAAAPTTTSPAQRTLERQAVDYVANGQYERAAIAYDQLAAQFPDRPAYREAARILRGRMDGGT